MKPCHFSPEAVVISPPWSPIPISRLASIETNHPSSDADQVDPTAVSILSRTKKINYQDSYCPLEDGSVRFLPTTTTKSPLGKFLQRDAKFNETWVLAPSAQDEEDSATPTDGQRARQQRAIVCESRMAGKRAFANQAEEFQEACIERLVKVMPFATARPLLHRYAATSTASPYISGTGGYSMQRELPRSSTYKSTAQTLRPGHPFGLMDTESTLIASMETFERVKNAWKNTAKVPSWIPPHIPKDKRQKRRNFAVRFPRLPIYDARPGVEKHTGSLSDLRAWRAAQPVRRHLLLPKDHNGVSQARFTTIWGLSARTIPRAAATRDPEVSIARMQKWQFGKALGDRTFQLPLRESVLIAQMAISCTPVCYQGKAAMRMNGEFFGGFPRIAELRPFIPPLGNDDDQASEARYLAVLKFRQRYAAQYRTLAQEMVAVNERLAELEMRKRKGEAVYEAALRGADPETDDALKLNEQREAEMLSFEEDIRPWNDARNSVMRDIRKLSWLFDWNCAFSA